MPKQSSQKQKQKSAPYVPITFGDNIAANTASLAFVHDVSALASGTVAAILGLQSIHGFLFFFATMVAIDSFVYISLQLNSNGNISNYFSSPIKEIFANDYSRSIFSFIMMWTLTFCLIDS